MSYNKRHDIGHMLVTKVGLASFAITAASTASDNIEQNGLLIDRSPAGTDLNDILTSAKVVVPYSMTIGTTNNTFTVSANVQHSATTASTAFTDFSQLGTTVAVSSVVETRTTAANPTSGILEINYDLSGAARYVRVQVTGNLSDASTAAGLDTGDIAAVWIFGGSEQPPAN